LYVSTCQRHHDRDVCTRTQHKGPKGRDRRDAPSGVWRQPPMWAHTRTQRHRHAHALPQARQAPQAHGATAPRDRRDAPQGVRHRRQVGAHAHTAPQARARVAAGKTAREGSAAGTRGDSPQCVAHAEHQPPAGPHTCCVWSHTAHQLRRTRYKCCIAHDRLALMVTEYHNSMHRIC
jgi:hypothetical protein